MGDRSESGGMAVAPVTELELTPGRFRDWLLVSEMFLTHQGEGASAGQLAYFLRLGACNQHCIGCDTAYTWAYSERLAAMTTAGKQFDPKAELRRSPYDRLAQVLLDQPARLIVISGGEPMLQAPTLSMLISRVNENVRPHRFEIETAGTVSPRDLTDYENVAFNVSPKLASSGNERELRYRPEILREYLALDSQFKFVIDWDGKSTDNDLREVEHIVGALGIPDYRVWLMPYGTDTETIIAGMQRLAPVAIEHGWNLSGRDHVLVWGNRRGH